MTVIGVQHYLGRARDFLEGLKSLREEEMFLFDDRLVPYRYSPALLAVHCVLSYTDAIRTALGCADLSSMDHRRAADDLEARLKGYREQLGDLTKRGPDQARRILGRKNEVAYAARELKPELENEIVQRAIRFSIWAERIGRKLNIEGW